MQRIAQSVALDKVEIYVDRKAIHPIQWFAFSCKGFHLNDLGNFFKISIPDPK